MCIRDSPYYVCGGHHDGLQQKHENVQHPCGIHAGDGAGYQPDWKKGHAPVQEDADQD